jgi:hypothetical protein
VNAVTIPALDAIELGEICELLENWLSADPAAAASYDRYIGQAGQARELRGDLRRLTRVLIGAPGRSR